jgi:predicted nucleotide-binding protein
VNPKIFIGSSSEALQFARAIHAELQDVAECTVWKDGAFGLSAQTVESLVKNLRESDFGIFVFSADDIVTIRGDLRSRTFQRLLGSGTLLHRRSAKFLYPPPF